MDHSLILVENNSRELVVQQAAANSFLRFPMHVVLLAAVVALIVLAAKRRWSWMLAPGIWLVLAVVTLRPMPAYRLTVDNTTRHIIWTVTEGGSERVHPAISLEELSAAGLQSGKSGSRPVLVRKDGSELLPLGTDYSMNEPVQLILTHHIQSLIDAGNRP